ncbi:MAG: PNGase F N-terminal domain-containing protein [Proteiniphilum sp.]|uniref:PNGase F N-terminal domain-containing protein n=1 Tax=Proteiniphilum sp. TaxID=1926877 RepID=UPI002B1E9EA5|nr:PNGase F N-terminal domain-containing protein [Proteiniphilum sp.]MEA5128199.1 PNGase F N-terminal domain-containing protein [Proteiniphilum sp.]
MKRAISIFLTGFLAVVAAIASETTTAQVDASKKDYKTIRITYPMGPRENASTPKIVMEISEGWARITTVFNRIDPEAPVQATYLDYNSNREIKTATLKGDESIYTVRAFTMNDGLEFLDETEMIAGYKCKKAKAIINSNTMEIWYTTELGMYGSVQPGVAIPEGVVLKVVRNGNPMAVANEVELIKRETMLEPELKGAELKASAFNYKIQQSRVIAVNVFDHESIYFRDIPKVPQLEEGKVLRFANGSILMKKVELPEENAGYSIFAELSHYSEGDAYDRTGSIFVIPTARERSFFDGLLYGKESLPIYHDKERNPYEGMVVTNDYLPPLELMRFYTSFGVRGYNHIEVADYNWPDSVVFRQEVTDYASVLKGEVWVGAWIGNYSHDGHNVTLDIKYYPQQESIPKEVYPLFTTVNIMEMAGQAYPENMFRNDSLTVNFTVDKDLKDGYIRYISTGHGGWGGGDEFNPKLNEIFLNGERIIAYTPWREDCGSYRERNPASGNFANGLSSSDLSRSGWCPGTVSYPVYIHVGDMKAGNHQLKVAIPVGDPAENSRSYWCISGVLVGEGLR